MCETSSAPLGAKEVLMKINAVFAKAWLWLWVMTPTSFGSGMTSNGGKIITFENNPVINAQGVMRWERYAPARAHIYDHQSGEPNHSITVGGRQYHYTLKSNADEVQMTFAFEDQVIPLSFHLSDGDPIIFEGGR